MFLVFAKSCLPEIKDFSASHEGEGWRDTRNWAEAEPEPGWVTQTGHGDIPSYMAEWSAYRLWGKLARGHSLGTGWALVIEWWEVALCIFIFIFWPIKLLLSQSTCFLTFFFFPILFIILLQWGVTEQSLMVLSCYVGLNHDILLSSETLLLIFYFQ